MEKLVHSYLTRNYYLKTDADGNDCIYAKDNQDIYYGDALITELDNVFSIGKKTSDKFINRWAKSIDSKIGLKYYWKLKDWQSIGLPISIRISAQTIGLDLVPVQPMATPKLLFLDYQYTGNTHQEVRPNRNGRVYDAVAINRAVDEYIEREERNSDERIRMIIENQQIYVSSRGRDK